MDHQAGLDRTKASDGLAQLLLTTAGDPRYTQDLAAPDIKAHLINGHRALIVLDGQVPDLKQRPSFFHHRPVNVQVDLPAHHPLRKSLLVGLSGVDRGDILALAQNGHTIRDVHHLIKLMCDDDDGVSVLLHPPQHGE